MPDKKQLIQLNDLQNETLFRLQLEVAGRVLDGLLELQLALPGNVQRWKEVGNQAEENWRRNKFNYKSFVILYARFISPTLPQSKEKTVYFINLASSKLN
jgi:hypothetical protein